MLRAVAVGSAFRLLGRADIGVSHAEFEAGLELLCHVADVDARIEFDVQHVFLRPLGPLPPAEEDVEPTTSTTVEVTAPAASNPTAAANDVGVVVGDAAAVAACLAAMGPPAGDASSADSGGL